MCITIVENEKRKKNNNLYTDTVCALSRLQLKVAQREELEEELSGLLLSAGAYEGLKMALRAAREKEQSFHAHVGTVITYLYDRL